MHRESHFECFFKIIVTSSVQSTLVLGLVLARQAGIRSPKGRVGPRLHDLRHRFAIRTMLSWYRNGVDIERQLPVLSTYLGHTNTANTYWYLSSVPELLCLAINRLDNDLGEISS